jgi:hypothetical protein
VRRRAGALACPAFVAALVALVGCGDHVDATPVAECTQYQAALESCFHRPNDFASQASLVPRTEADRERIRQVCSANLERIRIACR